MTVSPYDLEIKAIKLLQERSNELDKSHKEIDSDLENLKQAVYRIGGQSVSHDPEYQAIKSAYLTEMSCGNEPEAVPLDDIYRAAEERYQHKVTLSDILSAQDAVETEERIDHQIRDFNSRYGLDKWDYAIAGTCGLFAAMLDILCVSKPPTPTTPWNLQVNGTFNQIVQKAFNELLPPDISKALSKSNLIGAPDSSTLSDLLGAPAKVINPTNHRLRSLAHDPLLGFIFGVLDMLNGTCTVIHGGTIKVLKSSKDPIGGNVFQLLGRMMGHLLSDVNAPSPNANRGMGLPAPFMGLLRMLEGVPIGSSDFGKQIEYMYVKGYDFRQFVVSSIPIAIMEVVIRAFYAIKQTKLYGAHFGESIIDTMPTKMNPRFRIILAIAYGTSSAVNAGKVYITQDILNANYASWLGLAWNGFHALKWAMLDRHLRLWSDIEAQEIKSIEHLVNNMEKLSHRAAHLPI